MSDLPDGNWTKMTRDAGQKAKAAADEAEALLSEAEAALEIPNRNDHREESGDDDPKG